MTSFAMNIECIFYFYDYKIDIANIDVSFLKPHRILMFESIVKVHNKGCTDFTLLTECIVPLHPLNESRYKMRIE